MFVIGNLIAALAQGLDIFLGFIILLIFVRALISWVSPDPYNPIVQFLYRSTDPILTPIRRFLPAMPLDISPLIACFLIAIVKSFLVQTLFDIASRLR